MKSIIYRRNPTLLSVNARIADRVILDTVLKRILSPTFVESLLGEIQSQMVDTAKIDQEISNTNTLLVSTERSINRLLSLAEESGESKEIAVRLKQLRQERAEYNAHIMQLKATRAVDVPDISLEALSVVFSVWRQQSETAIQSGDILTAKRLLAQFVSKIELSREKAVIHYTFPLGIPSDSGSSLSAHKSPGFPGLFVFRKFSTVGWNAVKFPKNSRLEHGVRGSPKGMLSSPFAQHPMGSAHKKRVSL